MSYYSKYHWCAVPKCKNTSVKTPEKIWIQVPTNMNTRKKWFEAAERDLELLSHKSRLYFCEDHFDLEHDMENYIKYKLMGSVRGIKLRPHCIPSKFDCLKNQKSTSNESHLDEAKRRTMCKDSVQDHIEEDNGQASTSRIEAKPVPKKVKGKKKPMMSELDRFKRRLIRAVARLLIQEKKQEEEIWTQLKIETGSNCKLLWMRMRALTEKKLSHLLAANDRTQAIPKAARMSLTDWLLFDLVLVHQKIDLIGQDRVQGSGSDDPPALVKLFELVNKYNIEGLSGDKLAEAWSAATVYYNNQGHQCSPMLLQRRWYQLKELTREKFYNFWYAYRGTIKRLAMAEPHTPTPLQAAIAKKYKHLVICPFLEWEKLIENRLVTLPEEFERKMIEMSMEKTLVRIEPLEETPDLELIEPRIETIDLDNENEEIKEAQDSPATTVKIKEEPPDTDIDIGEIEIEAPKKSIYDVVLETTDIENEKLDSMDANEVTDDGVVDDKHVADELLSEEKEIEETIATTLREEENLVLPQITSVFGNVSDTNTLGNGNDGTSTTIHDSRIGEQNDISDEKSVTNIDETSSKDNVGLKPQGNYESKNIKETVAIDKINNLGNIDDATASEKVSGNNNMYTIISSSEVTATNNEPKVDSLDPKAADNVEDVQIIDNTPAPVVIPDSDEEDNIENSDDIVDDIFLPLHNDPKDVEKKSLTNPVAPNKDKDVNEITLKSEEIKPGIGSFSFGHLPIDVSFADEGIVFVEEDGDNETKAKTEVEDNGETPQDSPKIDPKLLMYPIVYTTRLDHMSLTEFHHINDKILIDTIADKSKPIKREPQTNISQNESDSDDNEIPESKKVKTSSYLLQKPRSRTYNPIQLCKNPDFNTRLKRLTVGFFTSPRNRGLIKTCKPLTIDVSKAFETKLISGTLYLKPSYVNVKKEVIVEEDVQSIQSATVVPSAMPAQSLIDNTKIPDILPSMPTQSQKPTPDVVSTSERSKVINLPDISEIRRINQRLLTAEVTPIQVQNNLPQVPVSIVASQSTPTCLAQKSTSITETDIELLKEADDIRGPPKCVDITEDLPAKTKQNLVVESGIYKPKKPRGRQAMMIDGRRINPPKPITAPWKPRPVSEKIPWLTKTSDVVINNRMIGETLLTLDTLNKMLFLLTEKDEPAISNKKILKKFRKSDKTKLKDQTSQSVKNSTKKASENNSANNLPEEAQKNCKVYVKPALKRSNQGNAPSNSIENKLPEPKKRASSCCWSRQRMLQLLFARSQGKPHKCPENHCKCCCQNLLKDYYVQATKIKQKGQSIGSEPDDECEGNVLTFISSTIHTVEYEAEIKKQVEIPVKVKIHLSPKIAPAITVEPLTDTTKNFISIDASDTSGLVPAATVGLSVVVATEVPSITTVVPPISELQPISQEVLPTTVVPSISTEVPHTSIEVPPISIEVPPISIEDQPSSTVVPPMTNVRGIETPVSVSSGDGRSNLKTQPYQSRTSSDKQKKSVPLSSELNPSVKDNLHSDYPPTYKKYMVARKCMVQKSLKKTHVQKSTPPPIIKPSTLPSIAPKKGKEKMILINSKHLSEKPTECPIFLGKNKILLTTVQFPPNLRQFEESKLALAPWLHLPKGVQLTCLPDGTISYSIDSNVPVNVPDLAGMPAIIEAVKAHMSLNSQVVPVNVESGVTDGEVVDLLDDDDDVVATPSTEDNKSNEPISFNEEPTTKDSQSTSDNTCKGTTNDQTKNSNETKEKSIDCIKDDNQIDTATENNQNTVTNQYTVTDIQERLVHSTEEAQGQLNTSILADDQLESTTQNKSNESQPTLAEHDHPDIEVSGQVEPLQQVTDQSQPESQAETDVDSNNEPSRNKSKNILSDLMEMSGIFDDGMTTATAPTESFQEQSVSTQVSAEESAQQLPTIMLQQNLVSTNTAPPQVKTRLGELSPITSLYELKYACVNKGAFFKLDFSTGYLVPINVCMKQNTKPAVSPSLINIAPKSVIDLTDDDDTVKEAAIEHNIDLPIEQPSPSNKSLLIANYLNTADTNLKSTILNINQRQVKPVKMYKALTPNILRILDETKMKRKKALEIRKYGRNTLNEKYDHIRKRKQVLTPNDKAVEEIATISSDDSSDEEPLSNFVKRRKENEQALDTEEGANEREASKETGLELTETTEDVDMSDNELTSRETLLEVDIDQSDEEEGCILGV